MNERTYISEILLAPSKAPSSITSMEFLLRSRVVNCGRRLNSPIAGILEMRLSLSSRVTVVWGKF